MSDCRRGCCWNNFGVCGRNRDCRCHLKDSAAIADLRFQQAILRHEAAKAGESPTYIDAFDHADRRRRA